NLPFDQSQTGIGQIGHLSVSDDDDDLVAKPVLILLEQFAEVAVIFLGSLPCLAPVSAVPAVLAPALGILVFVFGDDGAKEMEINEQSRVRVGIKGGEAELAQIDFALLGMPFSHGVFFRFVGCAGGGGILFRFGLGGFSAWEIDVRQSALQ